MAAARRTTLLLASILATILACLGLLVPEASATARSAGSVRLGASSAAGADCPEHASAPSSTIGSTEAVACRALCAAQALSGAAPKAEIASGRVIDRYYDPATGQFLSVDPDVAQTDQPYAYTEGDPVNETDPSGQMDVGPDGQSGCGTLSCIDEETAQVDAAAEAYYASTTCPYSTWNCLVMEFDPAYSLVAGTVSAYDAAQQPCSSNWTIAGDSFDALLGLGGTLGAAFGVADLFDGVFGSDPADPSVTSGAPKPSPNFIEPTNPPQYPPTDIPPGYSIRTMGPTQQYRDGYWIETNAGGQPIDPSTGKPPSNVSSAMARAMTHVPFPPSGSH